MNEAVDMSGRLQRDMAALQKAGTIGSNIDCLVILIFAGLMALGAVTAVLAGGITGVVMLVIAGVLGVVAKVTKLGEGLLMGVVAFISVVLGVGALAAAVYSAVM